MLRWTYRPSRFSGQKGKQTFYFFRPDFHLGKTGQNSFSIACFVLFYFFFSRWKVHSISFFFLVLSKKICIIIIIIFFFNFLPILRFDNSVRHQRLTRERPKFALHHGKLSANKCHAIQNYTWACFKWPKNVNKRTSHWNIQYNNNLHS